MAIFRIKKEPPPPGMEAAPQEEWQQLPNERQQENLDMKEIALLNTLDEEEEEEMPAPSLMPRWAYGLVAVLVLIAFSFWVWGDIFFSLSNPLPDLGFLSQSSQLAKEPALAALKPAVVSIDLPTSRGSGFNVSPEGLIITNRHVVENKGQIEVTFPTGHRYRGQSWQGIEGFDLAVVEIDATGLPYVPLSNQLPAVGEEVIFIGNPLGFDWTVSQGKIKSYAALDGYGTPLVLLEGPVYSGSSGSPVFNSQGEVVAVIFATLRDVENIGLAIPVQALQGRISLPAPEDPLALPSI